MSIRGGRGGDRSARRACRWLAVSSTFPRPGTGNDDAAFLSALLYVTKTLLFPIRGGFNTAGMYGARWGGSNVSPASELESFDIPRLYKRSGTDTLFPTQYH